jgi:protein TonB
MGARAVHKVDAEQKIHAFLSQGAAPPPPPPPPPPASSSAPKATPHPTIKPVQVQQHAFVQPTHTPKEVPKVEVPTSSTPTVDLTPSQPSEPSGETGGVKGGVEGGVAGGVVGGVVGGQVGGQLGGVLGGKIGGTGMGTEGEGSGSKEAAPAPEKPTGPLRVGGDVKAPVATHKVEPNYTDVARKASVSGVVIVEAIIDEHGNVDNVKIIKGLPMGLSEEAVTAVKKWKFRPGTMNGEPVPVIFNLTVNFALQ